MWACLLRGWSQLAWVPLSTNWLEVAVALIFLSKMLKPRAVKGHVRFLCIEEQGLAMCLSYLANPKLSSLWCRAGNAALQFCQQEGSLTDQKQQRAHEGSMEIIRSTWEPWCCGCCVNMLAEFARQLAGDLAVSIINRDPFQAAQHQEGLCQAQQRP